MKRGRKSGWQTRIVHKVSARDVLNALREKGAADQAAGPPAAPSRLCKRGHDTYKTGVYLYANSVNGHRYTGRRCRLCQLASVKKSRGQTSGVPVGW